jgi:hypothetical protein
LISAAVVIIISVNDDVDKLDPTEPKLDNLLGSAPMLSSSPLRHVSNGSSDYR